jgi:hypothetical protein
MEQTRSTILDYHKPESQGANAYWTRTVDGRETKYIRVIFGLAVPQLDRQAAAVIAIGEMMRSFAPPDFAGLAAAVGTWPEVKNALMQFCRDLKPGEIICENEQSRKLVFPITDSLVGVTPVSALSATAPAHALTELGRQNVELLINEGRLHIEHLLEVLDQEKEPVDKALRCAVNWALEFTAFYAGKKRGPLQLKRVLGTEGL